MAIKLDSNERQILIAEYQNNLGQAVLYTDEQADYAEARIYKLKQELLKALHSE